VTLTYYHIKIRK